jgi:hypothetical protein
MIHTLARPQKPCWQLSDGRQFDIGIGDEIEIDTFIPLVPKHRGLIYLLEEGTPLLVIHNNKGTGVEVVSWNSFSQGQEVRLRRRPSAPEHASDIWDRAHANIGHAYHALNNCEHFTDFYKGQQGESPTLQGLVGLGVAVIALIAAGNGSE